MKQKFKDKMLLNVLYLEDSPKDVEIIHELLIESGYDLAMDCTDNKKKFSSFLKGGKYDVILSDFKLPGFDAFGALQLSNEMCPEVPFICVSGSIGEETAIELIKQGAVDYVLKDRMVRLPSAIKRALDEVKEKELRQKAEEGLRNSKHMLQIVLDSIPAAVFWKDLDLNYLGGNYAWLKAAGLKSMEDVLGKSDYDLPWDKEQADAFREYDRKIIKSGIAEYNIIEKYLQADGTQAWARTNKVPLRDADNNIVGILGTYEDITKQKQAEDTIRKKDKQFKELFENAPVGYHEVNIKGIIININQTELDMLNFSSNEMIGWPVWEFAADRDASQKRVLAKLAGELPPSKNFESMYTRRDGSLIPVLIDDLMLRNEKGEIIGIRTTISDITARKQAEEALKASEAFLNSVIDQSPYPIWISDDKGMLLRINRACLDLLYIKEDEVVGKYNILKDNIVEQQGLMHLVRNVFEKGQMVKFEIKYDTSALEDLKLEQKTSVILDTTIFPVRDMKGIITNAVIQHVDITERRLFEEQMRQMQKLEGLGTLAGGVAHDFNNILGIILAYITNIEKIKNDGEKLSQATNTIAKAVQRGKTLVQQVLTFARKTETKFGPVNVNDIVMEIMIMILETFPKVITYTQNFDKRVPPIDADHSQIHQAILNLCVNARDAMPSGGVLTINTCMVTGTVLRDRHPDAFEKEYVCIEVMDTGQGMSKDIKKRIFEPFFTTKEVGKGTGLGLAVVYGVVQTHKGFIDVESTIGKGTTFRLYLPTSIVPEQAVIKDQMTMEELPGGTETLMIVEDEEALSDPLEIILNEKGYTVIVANDGFKALGIYKKEKNNISLVITDLGLPNMTGLDLCREIKKIKPDERLILATGYLAPDMKEEFLKTGVQHFLFKPYEMLEVIKIVREALDKK